MEVKYRHNVKSNYVVMKNPNAIVNDYRLHMLMKNDIEGFLKFCVSCVDGSVEFSYLISSKQSIKDWSDRQKLGFKELLNIIVGIIDIADKAHRYLLKIDDILLEPELIYMEYESNKVWFCYYPNSENNFYMKLKQLIQELLLVTEHGDRRAVELIYGIYEICGKTDFLIKDIEGFVNKCNSNNFYENVSSVNDYQNYEQEKNINMDLVCEKQDIIGEEGEEVFESEFKSVLKGNEIIKKISKVFGFSKKTMSKEYIKDKYCIQKNSNDTMLLSDISAEKGRILFSMSEQKNIQIDKVPFVIGKLKERTDYVIDEKSVSRIHLSIDSDEQNNFFVEDMNSKNGTFINGVKLKPYEKKRIKSGDSIKISVYEYIFR